MALKKSEIYSTLLKCANKLRSNSGIGAESFKNYVLIILFIKYVSDRKKSSENIVLEIPEGCTFDDMVTLKGTKHIGEGINKIIGRIIEANELQDFINLSDHDFCDKKLGNAEDSSKLISELIAAFQADGLDFSQNRAADDDLIGDAYEYLMRNFASQAGKDKGQFYTPTEVSRLMALLLGVDMDERLQISAYDPTCGSGSLLLRVSALAKGETALYGQDIDPANIELSYLNSVIHGYDTADIRVGDTLNNPQHAKDGKLMTFDYIVSNPAFSLHNWMNQAKAIDTYGRWHPDIGVPPQQYGDFAFLMHCVRSLKPEGKCAIILPNGVLTRGGDEERLRRWLVDQHLLSGIIAFPANAFFGTSIAGNVLVLDNARVCDGVFFIDGSNLGYKDADSKIRLREQDIKRVIDTWRRRKDVPHFAHLATYKATLQEGDDHAMHEIERNSYALNLSLYVAPVDKEIHQNIEAHLKGGIPDDDVERMAHFWEVCPSLKPSLFAPLRPGFCRLQVPKADIAATIEGDASFAAQTGLFASTLDAWSSQTQPRMLATDRACAPKDLIAQWSQSLLDTFRTCPTLIDAYDVYDQLMNYYNESLQDDLYMIANGGWMPQLIEPATKKTIKWTDLLCDLLPVSIAVRVLLPNVKAQLDAARSALENTQQQMAALIEENEDDFSEALFYGKLNAANVKKKLERCSARKLTDEEREFLNSLMPYFEKSNKANKEAVVKLRQTHEHLFEGVAAVTRKVVNTLLTNADHWEYSTPEQRALWQQYQTLMEIEATEKDTLKVAEKLMLLEIIRIYSEMTETQARELVVCHKWLVEIRERIMQELDTARHSISAEVSALAARYEDTLPELTKIAESKENNVMNHLFKMGFEL